MVSNEEKGNISIKAPIAGTATEDIKLVMGIDEKPVLLPKTSTIEEDMYFIAGYKKK